MPNTLHNADCLLALGALPPASVQLIYLDPPFNTNTRRTLPSSSGRRRNVPEGAGDESIAYNDSFGAPADYIAYMRPRVEHMRRVLSPNGSLFFHCDWRTSHHARLLLDEIFRGDGGQGSGISAERTDTRHLKPDPCFVNEIIWHYGLGASKARRHLLTKHDVIFWYANSASYTFNLIREEPTQAMLAKYRHVDEHGNRYMNSYGRRYTLKGGKPLDDVWSIPAIAPTSKERAGYPTQKPLTLLRRIIQLASNEGDVVLDPFCGSGTTLLAAQQLHRQWIGIDANPQAIAVARKRLGLF
jgi:site-specific DNA-methyltransferase (adenine-specific)